MNDKIIKGVLEVNDDKKFDIIATELKCNNIINCIKYLREYSESKYWTEHYDKMINLILNLELKYNIVDDIKSNDIINAIQNGKKVL